MGLYIKNWVLKNGIGTYWSSCQAQNNRAHASNCSKRLESLDSFETAAPIYKSAIFMTLFKLSVSLGCVMRQFDAKCAFEHSTIRKEVFLPQP